MRALTKALATGGVVLALSGGMLAAGALGGSPSGTSETGTTSSTGSAAAVPANALLAAIAREQERLRLKPDDAPGWAGLGVAYVSQARISGDPSWYAKAEGAIARSLQLNTATNYLGYAGRAALENARHDFRAAEASARKGIAINAYNSTLFGALGDALTQLGRYREAAVAIDQMNQLLPGVPAFTRASYVLELRGDVDGARSALERALRDATASSDVAFVRFYLGELAIRYGSGPQAALEQYDAGLAVAPQDAVLLAGRAKAEAALGRTDAAVKDYRAAVAARPEPQTVLELAELLDAIGDPSAKEQYALFRVQEKLYASAGVALDTESTLFEADHGSPAAAVAAAKVGWATRPFVEMADAYGWALHAAGRDREALTWADRAFASGWRTAPALYHRGMIKVALGDSAGARADLGAALRLDPHFNPLGAPKARAALAALPPA